MADNSSLNAAKRMKNDEYYTRYCDVQAEMTHYLPHFVDKVIYCNCDDPSRSAFWRYFHEHFGDLGLRGLIATHYDPVYPTYMMQYAGGHDSDITCGTRMPMVGNGDFRSSECAGLLQQCDVIATNYPFSLAREYVPMLISADKQFLIIGNLNAATHKSILPAIMSDKLWLGCTCPASFISPDGRLRHVGNAVWFTNLDHTQRHIPLALTHRYSDAPGMYQMYDGSDIINVNRTADMPLDYDGVMGVPVSYLTRHCPEQFRIVGTINHGGAVPWDLCRSRINGIDIYKRIAIQRV